MVTSVERKLRLKSDETGLEISQLVENYVSSGLDKNDLDGDVSSFVDFESLKQEDGLESIIGIAEAGYTDDVVQLKKDSRRF